MDELVNGCGYPHRQDRRGKDKVSRDKRRLKRDNNFGNNDRNNGTWANQSVMPPHRIMPGGDASYTPYPVHVSYPMEPFQFSLYPSVYPMPTPAPFCPVPPARKGRKSGSRSDSAKVGPRLAAQEYTSLPPANLDEYSVKSSDSDSNSKRHFSDPGIGPASSDESEKGCDSWNSPLYLNLMEEVRDLREKCRLLSTELTATKEQLLEIKTEACTRQCLTPGYQPGSISDVIGELRGAFEAREESILTRVNSQLAVEALSREQGVKGLESRLIALEEKLERVESRELKDASVGTERAECGDGDAVDGPQILTGTAETQDLTEEDKEDDSLTSRLPVTAAPDAFTMIRVLEEQKLDLERELQLAVHGKSQAEANTQKLERLVAILRTKVKGLSAEAHLPDQMLPRPLVPFVSCDHDGSEKLSPIETSTPDDKTKSSTSPNSNTPKNPPTIPPRPLAFSPTRPKTSPPKVPGQISDLNANPVGPGEVSTGEGLSTSGGTWGSATITITGPVTDL